MDHYLANINIWCFIVKMEILDFNLSGNYLALFLYFSVFYVLSHILFILLK